MIQFYWFYSKCSILILQAFFVQVNPHKDAHNKVSTGEIEFLSTIEHFNENENNNLIKWKTETK